jgi:CheY-like chemotaxis protein
MLSILIVDDSRVSRQIVRKALPPWDLDVREIPGGRECLRAYARERADVVLLDLTMPEMDGFETLARIRALDAGARVIVVTADIQPGAKERVLGLGASALLHKPVDPDRLLTALEDCIP